jgi:hypothetical protein
VSKKLARRLAEIVTGIGVVNEDLVSRCEKTDEG